MGELIIQMFMAHVITSYLPLCLFCIQTVFNVPLDVSSKETYLTHSTFKEYHYCPNPTKPHKAACNNFSIIPDTPGEHQIFQHLRRQ